MRTKRKYKKLTKEQIIKKLIDSKELIEKRRQELEKRGYTKKDIKLIKFMQKPTLLSAARFNCYECSGYSWAEAKACKNKRCPFHSFVFRGRGNKKDLFTHYRQQMIEVGELNPELDVNIDFSNLLDEEEDE